MKAWLVYYIDRAFLNIQQEVSICFSEEARDKAIGDLTEWIEDCGQEPALARVVKVKLGKMQMLEAGKPVITDCEGDY